MIKKEIEINGKTLRISTGQVAKQAAGSVLVSYGETMIIVAVNAAKEMREDINFCLLYTSPSPRDVEESRMPSSA